MSVPPPSSSFAPPGAGGSSLREFTIPLEADGRWKRRGAGSDVLRVSALGATLEHERMLREPLKLALGMLQIGIVELGSADAKSRFPILRRLSATAIVPREHGRGGLAVDARRRLRDDDRRRPGQGAQRRAAVHQAAGGGPPARVRARRARGDRRPLAARLARRARPADARRRHHPRRGDLPPVRHPAPADRPRGRRRPCAARCRRTARPTRAWPSTRRPAPRRPSRRPAWASRPGR